MEVRKMSELINYEEVEKRVLTIQGQQVLLDRDVAVLYKVETREINQAVKNNSDKFPEGYIIPLSTDEWNNLKSNFLISSWGGSRKIPSAFTEKGLYMLATILKSPTATQTTLAIVETFAKMREFARIITQLPDVQDDTQQKSLVQKGSEIFTEVLGDCIWEVVGDEIAYEVDLGVVKVKRIIKREKRKNPHI